MNRMARTASMITMAKTDQISTSPFFRLRQIIRIQQNRAAVLVHHLGSCDSIQWLNCSVVLSRHTTLASIDKEKIGCVSRNS